MIGKVIAQRYEVLEYIGEGALFQAFKARDRSLNRMVVVKTPLTSLSQDAAFSRGLSQLGAQLQDLSHPNIARLYEVAQEGDCPFLISEYVRGINLQERVRRIAPFTLSVAIDFAIAIGEAVHHAHQAGVIHGDLRPTKVIVSPEGQVKVGDFGVIKAITASPRASLVNHSASAPYLAPEAGETLAGSVSADVYSLGCILYEMLTGSPPYQGESPEAIARKRLNEPIPSPRSVNSGVPRSVEGITLKSLQRQPNQRYANMADLLNDLKAVRDALRFGKPLSWNPMERGFPSSEPPSAVSAGAAVAAASTVAATSAATAPLEYAKEPNEPTGTPTSADEWPPKARRVVAESAPSMPRQRRQQNMGNDDRIPLYVKIAMGTAVAVFVIACTVGIALWMAAFTKPPERRFPNLIGMPLAEARAATEKLGVRLIEHEQFNEKHGPGVIFRADWEPGKLIRPGRGCNVWVSRGSKMVWVPDVTRIDATAAEAKVKEAGLILGSVGREYNDRVGFDVVLSQNPRAGKRVPRDSAINLVISDGSKPLEPPTSTDPDVPASPEEDQTTSTYTLNVTITPDGRGARRVRIEYDDQNGTHVPIDEMHNEGDRISQRVEVTGREITIRIYYGDDPTPVSEQTKRVRPRS